MRRPLLLVPSLAVIAALTAACQTTSVVRTAEVGTNNLPAGRPYLVYPLATTMLVITVKKAGGGGGDKADKADTTNANTITIQNWVGGQKPESEKADEPPKPACDVVREAYKAQLKTRDKLISGYWTRVNAEGLLWSKPSLDRLDDQKAYRAILAEQAKAADADGESLTVARNLVAHFKGLGCKTPVSIEVSQKIVADTSKTFALYIADAAFSTDKVAIKLDANGFPTTISSTADDQTGEVITGALKSVANLVGLTQGAPDLGGLSGMQSAAFGGLVTAGAGAAPTMTYAYPAPWPKLTPEEVDRRFRAGVEAARLAMLAQPPAALPPLEEPLPEFPTQKLIRDLTDAPFPGVATSTATRIYDAYGYQVVCAPLTTAPSMLTKPKRTQGAAPATAPPATALSGNDGLVVSGQRSCELLVLKSTSWKPGDATIDFKSADTVSRTFFLAADSRSQQVVPISRTSLIARTNGYEFTDGRMTSLSYDKPSNALAVVSLPLKATGEVISGLSTAVQGQQGLIKAQSDLVLAKAGQSKADAEVYNAKAALLKAQTDLLAAQAAADKARKDQAAVAAQP